MKTKWIWFIPLLAFVYVSLWCFLYLEATRKEEDSLKFPEKGLMNIFLKERKESKNLKYLTNIKRANTKQKHVEQANRLSELSNKRRLHEKSAVVIFIPQNINYVNQFVTMLYGSWKYININSKTIFTTDQEIRTVDLLVFVDQKLFRYLPKDCHVFRDHGINTPANGINSNGNEGTNKCWKIHQGFETDSAYKNLNSFVMFLRVDIQQILKPYDYILRTDIDVFLTPAFYRFRPSLPVVTGIGGYTHVFNKQRLLEIANKMHLRHQKIHNIGSSWYGKTEVIIRLSKEASNLTRHIYDNEFRPGLTGLESFDLLKNPDGKWPKWYRGTASMYGSELAINDIIDNLSFHNFAHFDITACNPNYIKDHYHLHAYHTECEFNKRRFMNILHEFSSRTSVSHRTLEKKFAMYSQMKIENIEELNCTTYATFIAWHSAANYLEFRLDLRDR